MIAPRSSPRAPLIPPPPTNESPRPGAAAVASPHAAASRVGADVLADGGNALDAAVATNAMLGVVYPHMCGVGGDLFLLHHSARDGSVACLNASGPAPRRATREAFRERGLEAVPIRGPLPVTVPGATAGWAAALERFGSRPLAELLAPAARAAEEGVEVTSRLAAWIEPAVADLAADPVLRRRFLTADGAGLPAGALLRQPELAHSLRRLMRDGAEDFYRGGLAEELDAAFRTADGFLRAEDLAAFEPSWDEPVRAAYRGLEVVVTAPNSQGVTALLMLNALAAIAPDGLPPGSGEHLEALIRAKRSAFADRDRLVSDPRFVAAPLAELLTPAHAQTALEAPAAAVPGPGGGDTVYLCTTDREGNACSLIQSLFSGFGSAFTAGETGILLHNRGHYFSLAADHPNRLEPGKRTLHTLMACMAFAGGELRLVFGTMGGDGQAQTNVQVLERHLAGAGPQAAVAAPRLLHGRFYPEDDADGVSVEAGMGEAAIAALRRRGHRVEVLADHDERLGHAHAIELRPDGTTHAGSDPRSDGAAIVL